MLFTRRFIKDLIVLVGFCLFFYALTHNPLSYPKIPKSDGDYSIVLMQYPLILGVAGHNYLSLRDPQGDILRELHGLATDPKTDTWKYVGNDEKDELKVWEFTTPDQYIASKSYAGVVLYHGPLSETASLWSEALICKEKINTLHLLYPPYGINIKGDTENSNSVAYTLMLCMGLSPDHLGLITPGSTKNLLGD